MTVTDPQSDLDVMFLLTLPYCPGLAPDVVRTLLCTMDEPVYYGISAAREPLPCRTHGVSVPTKDLVTGPLPKRRRIKVKSIWCDPPLRLVEAARGKNHQINIGASRPGRQGHQSSREQLLPLSTPRPRPIPTTLPMWSFPCPCVTLRSPILV